MTQDTSAAVRAEAAAWVARLHSSGRTPALEVGLRRWLKADPAHVRAFEIATEAWEIGGALPAGALPRMASSAWKQPRARGRGKLVALGAVLSLMVCAGLYMFIRNADTVSTQVGEQRILTLEDGSRIYLNTHTRLQVHYRAEQRLVQLERGEAMFDVAKNPQRPFVVEAGETQVKALGTSFVVRRETQQLSVTLIEGKVAVSDPPAVDISRGGATPHILEPGQRLTFDSKQAPAMDRPSVENLTAWRRGEVILDKTPLRDALEEMNRYSETELTVQDPAIADIRLSGIFRAGDSLRFAQAVSLAYGLQVTQAHHQILISSAAL